MKTIYLILICLLINICLFLSASAQDDAKQQLSVPLSNPGKAGRLKVNLNKGSVRVVGYEGKEVIIEASAVNKDDDEDDDDDDNRVASTGMKRISNRAFSLEVEENNNEVDIETDSWKRKIDLVIRVPRSFSLKLGAMHIFEKHFRSTTINFAIYPFLYTYPVGARVAFLFYFRAAVIYGHIKIGENIASFRFYFSAGFHVIRKRNIYIAM